MQIFKYAPPPLSLKIDEAFQNPQNPKMQSRRQIASNLA